MACMRYLARQGLAFRGHEVAEGNLYHLVKFTAAGGALLSSWLTCSHDYISPQCQNDYLTFCNAVLRRLPSQIRSLPMVQFSIIMDGTQDMQEKEQVSTCLRYVDKDLMPQEICLGTV